VTGWIAFLPLVRKFEAMILRLPPYATMVVFLLPMLTLFPLKVLAVYWLTCGYWFASVALLVTAKVLGTAIVARMYVVCQPKLMTIAWFRKLHRWLTTTRDMLYAAVRAMPFFLAARKYLTEIKLSAKRFMSQFQGPNGLWARWRAIRRWHRQKNKL
jgi:hypothetical protein